MLIVESHNSDVYRNLAIEEYLMDEVSDQGPILFLWRSAEAVVVGKNQNPWRECRLDLMEREGVPLARRVSGGGTVYHDMGNLNYCVITRRDEYKEPMAFQLVSTALASFGVDAAKTGKSNLSVGGLKFSGNAFAFRKGRAMHHGTLLLDANLTKLNRYLGSMFSGIRTKAISSCPAEVMNLHVDREALIAALKAAFQEIYSAGRITEWSDAEVDSMKIGPIIERQMSEEWLYFSTPRFSVDFEGVAVEVEKGEVKSGPRSGEPFHKIAFSHIC